jgi:hypothetical protein
MDVYPTDGFGLSEVETRSNDVATSWLKLSHLTMRRPLLERQDLT